ncbi:dihydrodipicolinate synthase family protein [Veillonella magna]|uniref:dihydrodipicolinate synthase family protein n=1 Tax=Veillonella magna TaxID=464322 RepID=UPI0026DD0865|nr:dihydrodipicolinate synthase family protein [Veillonella magna]
MMFKGVYSPIITIFKDNGEIDYANMELHINHLVEAGLNGILFFGSLGEFYAISLEEKKKFIEFAVKLINKRVQVIIGVGGTDVRDVIELANFAETAGADAINIISPYYFGPTEEAAKQYFKTIADAVKLPIMLYNFADRTGSDLSPAVVSYLAENCPSIVGIKDTVDNISHTRRLCQAVKPIRPDFSVLSGFDEYYMVNRISGGDGVLCGLTNVVPEVFVKMHKAYEDNDKVAAVACAEKIASLMRIYEVTGLFIVAMKAAVKATGLPISTFTKAPGMDITPEEYAKVECILKENGII